MRGSNASRLAKFSTIVPSRFSKSAFFAAKNVSCAVLKRAQSFASSDAFPRPAAFHLSIKAL